MGARKKFLITGAAGFVGSNLAARLGKAGNDVLGVDNFSNYYSPELKQTRVDILLQPYGIPVVDLDLAELELTREFFANFGPDYVIHLAAQPGVRTPLNLSSQYVRNNITAFTNVLQTTVELEIPNFLYASSSSVYGNSTSESYSEGELGLTPISIYGATKLANEILTPTYIANSLTRARGLRFFTVYGPWGRPDMAYFRIINSILNNVPFQKFGNGEIRRDFTFVEDISIMIEALSAELNTRPCGFSDVVNIGGGSPHSLNELIVETNAHFNKEIESSELLSNPNDTNYTCANISKLLSMVGPHKFTSLSEGVLETLNWARLPEISHSMPGWVNSSI